MRDTKGAVKRGMEGRMRGIRGGNVTLLNCSGVWGEAVPRQFCKVHVEFSHFDENFYDVYDSLRLTKFIKLK